jgi:hypothetical protein
MKQMVLDIYCHYFIIIITILVQEPNKCYSLVESNATYQGYDYKDYFLKLLSLYSTEYTPLDLHKFLAIICFITGS